ncbi:MAG: helix-hairpin-helix domain-containing protein, partial [Prevotella sp.]|nr:helix-hairpin-helix domain-containing protein [Prevotella sp.]
MKEFFYFQKSDRHVLLVLLGVAAFFMSLVYFLGSDEMDENEVYSADSVYHQSYTRRYPNRPYKRRQQPYYAVPETKSERFPFDPNTADSTQFLRLGLQPWQIRNIYKYRAHGGIYRKPTDFARLYGLTLKQYKSLEPYIRISSDYLPAAEYYEQKTSVLSENISRDTLSYPRKISMGEYVLLNEADTSNLKQVPGIGSYYARAVIRYGERLGGYYDVSQLLEIKGFPEESISYFRVAQTTLRKINVNTMSLEQLRKHPYIGFYQAKAIVEYRR